MCELMITFGKHKNMCACHVAAIDPGYMAQIMWAFTNMHGSKFHKDLLEQGYDKISPTIGFKSRHHGSHIADVRRSDPNYYKWMFDNIILRQSCKAIDRWMRAHPNGTIGC